MHVITSILCILSVALGIFIHLYSCQTTVVLVTVRVVLENLLSVLTIRLLELLLDIVIVVLIIKVLTNKHYIFGDEDKSTNGLSWNIE